MGTSDKTIKPVQCFLILAGAFISNVLISPRWTISLFAWLAIFFLLLFSRTCQFRRKWIWMGLTIFSSGFLANRDVFPMPVAVIGVLLLLGMIKLVFVYWLNNSLLQKQHTFVSTLIFPSLMVANEFLDAQGGGGVWGSIANTQFDFPWLMQLASVTGIWGITFLVCWTASVLVWVMQNRHTMPIGKKGGYWFVAIFLLVIGYGAFRYQSKPDEKTQSVVVGGLTIPSFSLLEGLFQDVNGKQIKIPWTVSQSSPQLQQVNEALLQFIENPDSTKFPLGFRQLALLHDSLFLRTTTLAKRGARLITWSEANGFLLKNQEEEFKRRGQQLAHQYQIYLLMPVAVIHPGKVTRGKKFMENKTWLIDPEGRILNEFFKNRPVPMVESSIPGDQQIPVIQTSFGVVSPSICYDADFPALMRQTGKKGSDLLLLPSGDWYAISPYHSYMARYRAIENGISVLRQVSGGLSMVCDSRGRILHRFDFYQPGEKMWTARIELGHESTIYQQIGDWLAWSCSLLSIGAIAWAIFRRFGKKKKVSGGIPLQG